MDGLRNWAGNVRFQASHVERPRTLDELQGVIRRGGRSRALGTGHSFSPIADTTGALVSVAALPQRIEIAADRRSATASAGMRLGVHAAGLHTAGLALGNLPSLPHISLAGAVATGTHGSGVRNASLAAAVTRIELVVAAGELVSIGLRDPRFPGAVVSLGCLGIVTSVTVAVEPTYHVSQTVYEAIPARRLETDLDEILAAGHSVSIFTTWRPDRIEFVWVKRRTDAADGHLGPDWMGGRQAAREWHPIASMSPAVCTPQLGVPGQWHERLPHFRLGHTPSSGAELQTEYLIPRRYALDAIGAMQGMRAAMAPVLRISEIRSVAGDGQWLSPTQGNACIGIHCTWTDDVAAVMPVVDLMEQVLAPFQARPHWGKLFGTGPARIASLYPTLADFRALRQELDPHVMFGNSMLDGLLDGDPQHPPIAR